MDPKPKDPSKSVFFDLELDPKRAELTRPASLLRTTEWGGLAVLSLIASLTFPPYFVTVLLWVAGLNASGLLWVSHLDANGRRRLREFEREFAEGHTLEESGDFARAAAFYDALAPRYADYPKIAEIAVKRAEKVRVEHPAAHSKPKAKKRRVPGAKRGAGGEMPALRPEGAQERALLPPLRGGSLVQGLESALEGAAQAFQRADYDAVRQSLEPALGSLKGPALGQACLYLGLSLKEQGLQSEAEARLREAIRHDPSSPMGYGVLADLLMAQGRHAEAAASYQAAMDNVKDASNLPALLNDLGVAHFRAGDLDKAAEAFKAVLKERPDDANALHNLGMLYLKQGLGEEMRQDLREFLQAEKAEQLLLGLTRSLVAGARGQAAEPERYGIVGQSRSIRDVMDLLGRAAASDANVLLLGENGTGKELVARAVHLSGPRASGPFVAVNCAALPETLLESELFGYEKGAFTGAAGTKQGRFELAAGGTLFLDEIGDLQPSLQVKLLRAVQEKSFERLGGTRTISADFRLVTATHRDLRRMVLEGRFREDLFYRLFVIPIQLPPLRERPEDIELLATHFLARYAARLGRKIQRLAPDALRRLREHAWPGNVRELENLLERAVAIHDEALLSAAMLQFDTVQAPVEASRVPASAVLGTLENAEKQVLMNALARATGPAEQTAAGLGMSRVTFFRKLKKHGLKYQI